MFACGPWWSHLGLRGCITQLGRKRSGHTDPAATRLAYKEAVSHKKLYQGLPVDQSITVSKYVEALGAMMQSQGWIVFSVRHQSSVTVQEYWNTIKAVTFPFPE